MSRIVVIALSSLVLVGIIGVATFGFVTNWDWSKKDGEKQLASTSKAVQAICQPTDYKDSCVKSLANVRTDDPKELVRAAFNSAKNELAEVAKRSQLLKDLEKDPNTADAVRDCRELFQDAIDDFERSFNEVGKFEWNQEQVNGMLADLKTWISATRTYQETCLDGFENTTGDPSAKVRKVLQISIEMSSNGLAIVNDLSSLFASLNAGSFSRRRLLSHQTNTHRRLMNNNNDGGLSSVPLMDDEVDNKRRKLLNSAPVLGHLIDNNDGGLSSSVPLMDDEVDNKRRKLLNSAPVLGHSIDNNDYLWPDWVDGSRRKLLETPNLSSDLKAKANVVVAQDGSGKYKTIEEALKDIPRRGNESFIVYIKEGVYNEYLVLFKWQTNVIFIGDGPTKTRITNNKNFADGVRTFKTATLSVLGDFFMAKDIGIENSAGAIKHQAVAFRAQSDKSIFYNCHFDGYQDTLYAHTYRQFYRDCKISGTIDFIFGDATAFFQNCTFVVRKPLDNQNCIVTAQGRMERHQPTGIFIHKSQFVGEPDYLPVKDKNKAYLGRPWKQFSKTIIMESQIDEIIQGDGWLPWEGDFGLATCYYGEYNNVGAGSSLANRVKWHGVKTIVPSRAESFMPPKLYESDDWIKAAGIPYEPNLTIVASGPTMSGVDEDPNAPAEAPSSIENGYSSSSGTSYGSYSSGSSQGSTSSSSGSSSFSGNSQGSSSSSGSSSSTSSSNSGSSTETPSKESPLSSTGEASSSSNGSGSSTEGSSSESSSSITPAPIEGSTTSDAPTPTPSPSTEAPLATPSPTPTPSSIEITSASEPTTTPTGEDQSASSPSPTLAPTSLKVEIGPVTVRELERILMENEEMEEDEGATDDMSGNVPDGDEPSPARAENPSPAPSPSNIVVAPTPSQEEIAEWLPPAGAPTPELIPAPAPNDEADIADKVSPTQSKPNYGTKSHSKLHVIFSGIVLWATLFMSHCI